MGEEMVDEIFDKIIAEARDILCVTRISLSPEEIAACLQIPLDELRRYFAHELEHGQSIANAKVLGNLTFLARQGSVAAAKLLFQVSQPGKPVVPPLPAPPPPRPKGKKERLEIEAAEPPASWAQLLN
jgi:hypothetical protein